MPVIDDPMHGVISDVIEAAAIAAGVEVMEVTTRSRAYPVALARMSAIYVMRVCLRMTPREIAPLFGICASAAGYAVREIRQRIRIDPQASAVVKAAAFAVTNPKNR